jgi:hypothetical protein
VEPPPIPVVPPPIPDVPPPVEAAPPSIEAPAAPAAIEGEREAEMDADITLDLDAALAQADAEPVEAQSEPVEEPPLAPAPPEPPAIDLEAAIAAFNDAFGGQPAPQTELEPPRELALEPDPVIDTASALDELFTPAPEQAASFEPFEPEPPVEQAAESPPGDPVLADLEEWLSAIKSDRDARGRS